MVNVYFFLREAQFVVVTVRFINNIKVDIVFIEFNDCVLWENTDEISKE